MRWTRIPGHEGGIVFAPIKPPGTDSDPMYRWIEMLERERTARERGRLLYVAATRAKRVLHLLGTGAREGNGRGRRVREPQTGSMLRLLWPEVKSHFESTVQTKPQQDLFAAASGPSLRVRRLPPRLAAAGGGYAMVTAKAVNVSELEAQLEFDWASQAARHIGTLVHRELDRLVRAGVDRADARAESRSSVC